MYFRPLDLTMENTLSHVIFCWFFATTTHQRIIFMFLVKTSGFNYGKHPIACYFLLVLRNYNTSANNFYVSS